MTEKEKDLLFKDLCARLPYGVKCKVVKRSIDGEMLFIRNGPAALDLTVDNVKELVTNNMYEITPYLFPRSSMTEEQKKEYKNITFKDGFLTVWTTSTYDWFNKNHFDYRGLIEKGLAIDVTGLNVY